eukprot:RCo011519
MEDEFAALPLPPPALSAELESPSSCPRPSPLFGVTDCLQVALWELPEFLRDVRTPVEREAWQRMQRPAPEEKPRDSGEKRKVEVGKASREEGHLPLARKIPKRAPGVTAS